MLELQTALDEASRLNNKHIQVVRAREQPDWLYLFGYWRRSRCKPGL